jgi:hypothetical protein
MEISDRVIIGLYDALQEVLLVPDKYESRLDVERIQEAYEWFEKLIDARFDEWLSRQPDPEAVTMADFIDALDGGNRRGR